MLSNTSEMMKKIEITDVQAEMKFKLDDLGGFWLEELKFKIPKDVDEQMFLNNLNLVCYDDKFGELVLPVKELAGNFLAKDKLNFYTLTRKIHLAGPDETTVLYYSFDDCEYSKNITKDQSGNRNHGIIYGEPKCVDGVKGKALKFDNTTQYISSKYANLVSNRTLSYCTWVNMKSFDYENQFIYIKALDTGTTCQRFFYFSSWCGDGTPYNCTHGGIINTDGSWGRGYVTGRHFELNKWYFICQIADTINGKIEFWKNGGLFYKKVINKGDIPGKPINIWIAGTPEGYQHLTGINDESILFNKVLTSYEIKTMYHLNCWKKGARWFLFVGKPEDDGIMIKNVVVE
jgi:hypothetical protein